jgi:cytosine/adenosine deaminase-related metal-dependent hydrolase
MTRFPGKQDGPSDGQSTGRTGPGPGRTTVRIDAAGLADADRSIRGPVSVWVACPADPRPSGEPLGVPVRPHDAGRCEIVRIAPTPPESTPPESTAPNQAGSDDHGSAHILDRTNCVLIPGLVNAHSHLDLTALGPRAHDTNRGFVEWVRMIIDERPTDPAAIRASIAAGTGLTLAGGVVAVGDIIGAAGGVPHTAGLGALAESPLEGVGFIEYFGIAVRKVLGISVLHDLAHEIAAWPASARIRPGLHPHAPNTVSLPLYEESVRIANRDGFPISTHLAESPEERTFIAEADGPQRDLLERMGIWDESELEFIGTGRHPVAHLEHVLSKRPFVCAHVNDADDRAIGILAETGASVAYCPRASAYFGAPAHFGPHRFRDMLDAGVNVCLGTDSIVNLDTPDRISPLDDARLLARTTDADARTLLSMMTTRGAAALGLDPDRYRFRDTGPIAGIVAVPIGGDRADPVDPADAVVRSAGDPELLLC